MIKRVERLRLLRHQRIRRSRDPDAARLRRDSVGARADGQRLSSEDDAGVSTTTTTSDEYCCESQRRKCTGNGSRNIRAGRSLPCTSAE